MQIKKNISASDFCTLRLGGLFSELALVESLFELQELLFQCFKNGCEWRVLGEGSNLLLKDELFLKLAIKLGAGFREFPDFSLFPSLESVKFSVGASSSLMSLSRKASSSALSGLEFASGIPASVGGAIFMNAGAHGSCMQKVLSKVSLVDEKGELREFTKDQIEFSYRRAKFPCRGIIVSAEFLLQRGDARVIEERRAQCLSYRKKTQPLSLPSAGSTFKNPVYGDLSSGELLERAGLKGFRRGGAMFSQLHANWIVKCDESARAQDVLYLLEQGQEKVGKLSGFELSPELIIW